jgi:hypothetical protein
MSLSDRIAAKCTPEYIAVLSTSLTDRLRVVSFVEDRTSEDADRDRTAPRARFSRSEPLTG